MKTWQIWQEGYLATGMEGIPAPARLLAEVEAETFQEACDILCSPEEFQIKHGYVGSYKRDQLTLWACRLFDNEEDARKFERDLGPK